MHPEPFELELFGTSFHVLPYTTSIILALCTVIGLSWWALSRKHVRHCDSMLILGGSACGTLIGARVLNGILRWELYREEYWRWFDISASGFSLYGGVIVGIICGFVVAMWRRVDPWHVADIMAPIIGVGVAIIRFGCYLRGCCFGQETDSVVGVTFPALSPAHIRQLQDGSLALWEVHAVHPTQLYEVGGVLCASIIAWILARRDLPWGVSALVFILFFTSVRFVTYFFHAVPDVYPLYFYPGLYTGMLLVGIFLLQRRYKRG